MSILHRIGPWATSIVFLGGVIHAQQTGTGSVSITTQATSTGPGIRTIRQHAPSSHLPIVVGAPYSAEVVTERTQTLADGTHITNKSQSTKRYRDSQGRTRMEMNPGGVQVVEIHDPISGFRYLLEVTNRIAHRYGPPAESQNKNGVAAYSQTARAESFATNPLSTRTAAPVAPVPQAPERTMESLGTQVMEGVSVEGSRITTTTPVGQIGNDRPLVGVMESWYSPELKITVLSKHSSPVMGEFTTRLQNIDRSEPDPALFRVPADFQIVDETSDEVEVRVARP